MYKKFLKTIAFLLLMGSAFPVYAARVDMSVKYDDYTPTLPPDNKSPILVPEVDIEDYTLTFDDSCLGCELRLVDENDNVVYTTTITSNTLVLPSTLSGEYELQIISGIYCFYGYIEL